MGIWVRLVWKVMSKDAYAETDELSADLKRVPPKESLFILHILPAKQYLALYLIRREDHHFPE